MLAMFYRFSKAGNARGTFTDCGTNVVAIGRSLCPRFIAHKGTRPMRMFRCSNLARLPNVRGRVGVSALRFGILLEVSGQT